MTPEKNLKNRIRQNLRNHGAYVYCAVPQGMGYMTLDILACWAKPPKRGMMLAIEVKTPGNKPTPRQEATAREIEAAGGIVFWTDSFEGYLSNMVMKGLLT